MDLFEKRVLDYIERYRMFDGAAHCVCGVSGGADSVSLLTVLVKHRHRLGIDIHVVHVNHMIRGSAADADEEYVHELCDRYGVDCRSRHIDVQSIAADMGLTVEEAGRKARYREFAAEQRRYMTEGCVVAVAHNRNDVAETVLFNMARGTGIAGIKGIVPVRDGLVRPLLGCDRADIEDYLDRNGIAYCTDMTNEEDDYARNKIRHRILPALETVNDRAVGHICEAAELASEYEELAMELVGSFLCGQGIDSRQQECGWDRSDGSCPQGQRQESYRIDIKALTSQNRLIQELTLRQMIGMVCGGLKDIGRNHVSEVMKLLDAQTGAEINLPSGARAYVEYGSLVFTLRERCAGAEDTQPVLNLSMSEDAVYDTQFGRLKVRIYDRPESFDIVKKEYTKCIDYDKIKQCLQLRTCRTGDYIVINSSGSVKKLNRLFTDSKIPQHMRGQVPLVCSGSEVVWAVGMRIGENYKITASTARIIELTLDRRDTSYA